MKILGKFKWIIGMKNKLLRDCAVKSIWGIEKMGG